MKTIRGIITAAAALLLVVIAAQFLDDASPQPSNAAHRELAEQLGQAAWNLPLQLEKSSTDFSPRPSKQPSPRATPSPTMAPSVSPPTPAAPSAPPTTAPAPPSWADRMAAEVLRLVNEERSRAGCGSLHVDGRLATAAQKHSADMANRRYFNHTSLDGRTPWERSRAEGYERPTGENIAMGHATAGEAVHGWMESPGHRANIVNCNSHAMGVGVVKAGNGNPYWTQLFGAV